MNLITRHTTPSNPHTILCLDVSSRPISHCQRSASFASPSRTPPDALEYDPGPHRLQAESLEAAAAGVHGCGQYWKNPVHQSTVTPIHMYAPYQSEMNLVSPPITTCTPYTLPYLHVSSRISHCPRSAPFASPSCTPPDALEYDPGPHRLQAESLEAPAAVVHVVVSI